MLEYCFRRGEDMRVISGRARGVKLKTIEGMGTRPTTDRIKESMFNLMQPYIRDQKVLDLYAGSGSLGIEALSRGADSAQFVESDRKCMQIILDNIEKTRIDADYRIHNTTVERAIMMLGQKEEKFGLIVMDPPYGKGLILPTLKLIHLRKILDVDGIIVIEHEKNDILEDEILSFRRIKCKHYGITTISMYEEVNLCE